MATNPDRLDVDAQVNRRYGAAAHTREEALCCAAIPREVLERDYGCGDPSRHVRPGDRVLDLGSGGGKICFIAAQVTGPSGSVIGVDQNEEMLALARGAAPAVAKAIGYANVAFHRARIQDLRLDLDRLDRMLRAAPVRSASEWTALESRAAAEAAAEPLIADASIDIVLSNCVLNLVRPEDKRGLVHEIHRVLAPGGRIAISDIVSDAPVPDALQQDPELWSGCVSGAFEEGAFVRAFEAAGFHGLAFDRYDLAPFRVVDGITFRSVTLTGRKGEAAACGADDRTVVYRGPWRSVEDDEGHVLRRGQRTRVCQSTFDRLSAAPYAEQVVAIPRAGEVAPETAAAKPACC